MFEFNLEPLDEFGDSYLNEEERLREAMWAAHDFLTGPRWQFLKQLGFPPKLQVAMIGAIIKYFADEEEYEKCADLVKVQDKVRQKYHLTDSDVTTASGSAK